MRVHTTIPRKAFTKKETFIEQQLAACMLHTRSTYIIARFFPFVKRTVCLHGTLQAGTTYLRQSVVHFALLMKAQKMANFISNSA